jgi:hypothetical protein
VKQHEVNVSEFLLGRPQIDARALCKVPKCHSAAIYTPVLCVAQLGRQRVSRVTLPAQVCREHRETFEAWFLTPARRASMEVSLRSHGRDSPDWARTHVEFVGA